LTSGPNSVINQRITIGQYLAPPGDDIAACAIPA